ncbi:phosphoenolpyruvate-protein phosphotransferase [Novimethylophilus kurashikiensis]|uniref:Phosphoenolpyruvate-protein phosphotransferase n=1 Tax=Novimethylophilus kurashikiensis TaxID=1825523 RepID=A0A2R5F937_9PROT|nr:hypothetical protein [Novimethylophilus kurashikiensis]GBG14545.1 phosphoenolpyruvate-protein phosphotransferase [Novimethylophilus kurashikiensis]
MATTIASLYLNRMVPLAQLLKLLDLSVQPLLTARQLKYKLGSDYDAESFAKLYRDYHDSILDTLHLLNGYLQSVQSAHEVTLYTLDANLGELFNNVKVVLEFVLNPKGLQDAMQSKLGKAINGDRHLGCAPQAKAAETIYVQGKEATKALSEIGRAINYSQASRNSFIQTCQRLGSKQELMKNGRLNYWMTLVSNLPWDSVYEALGVKLPAPQNEGSHQGQERLNALVTALPGYKDFLRSPQLVISASKNNASKIPSDVAVSVVNGNFLLEKKVAVPACPDEGGLEAEYGAFLRFHAARFSDDATRTVSVECAPAAIIQGLSALKRQTDALLAEDVALWRRYEAHQRESRSAVLMDRLNATFTPEEIAQLKKHLAV